jgi:hypothetical protein
MKKIVLIALSIGLLFSLASCGAAVSPMATESLSPAAPATQDTASPSPQTSPSPADQLTGSCNLLSSRDVASLFVTAEVEGPTHQVSQVDRPVFATENISATELSCIYYVFHQPGSKEMLFLQVTYWVDLPGSVTPAAWIRAWTEASAQATEAVSGIGDAAFYKDGRLSFEKGSVYVTIEVIGTGLNAGASGGTSQQIDMEKQMALDALTRLE